MQFILQLKEANRRERRVPLADGSSCVVGTEVSDTVVRVFDPMVSRRHAEFKAVDGRVFVLDRKSMNGTSINGRRLSPESWEAMRVGDQVGLGSRVSVAVLTEKPPSRQTPRGLSPAESASGKNKLIEYRRSLRSSFIEKANRAQLNSDQPDYMQKVKVMLEEILAAQPPPRTIPLDAIKERLLDDVLGLGPLEMFIKDDTVDEIMVQSRKSHGRTHMIFVERKGRLEDTGEVFDDENQLRTVIEKIVSPLGRRVDESSPLVDARLSDGSRVNAIIPPLAIDGPSLTIRKFKTTGFSIDDLIARQSLSAEMAKFSELCVANRLNILISGGTGSGKTTLLNVIAAFIPEHERIVTIEDAAELRLPQLHVVRLESKPPNIEGKGAITIRDLVRNALRMRPDRIVVGECRGGEAIDMIQAMNTGHDGSMTTAHANTPRDALRRLGVMCLMADLGLPHAAIREMIVSSLNIIIQIRRMPDGSRKITNVCEITGIQGDQPTLQDIFHYIDGGVDSTGKQCGRFEPTGCVPLFTDRLRERGVEIDLSMFRQ